MNQYIHQHVLRKSYGNVDRGYIFDVPGAFLQTDMPESKNSILVIRNKFVGILCEVNPEY